MPPSVHRKAMQLISIMLGHRRNPTKSKTFTSLGLAQPPLLNLSDGRLPLRKGVTLICSTLQSKALMHQSE